MLRLQRTVGNRRTCMLLRNARAAKPTPMTQRRGEFPQIMQAHHPGGLNQKEWSDTLKAAKAALDSRDHAAAGKLYSTLYFDLAATAGAVKLRDVANGAPINIAKGNDIGFAPGLNLVLGSGASKAASTGFVDASGNFGVEFDAAVKAGTPRIAIRMYSGTFKEDKADTLRVLRHEMLHARHREQAIDSLKGGKSAPQNDVDKAVVRDIKLGGSANTELLAYVEGFMTAFHLTPPAPQHALFIDLARPLGRPSRPWRSARERARRGARAPARVLLQHDGRGHRAAFDAWVASLEAQVAKDAKAIRDGAAAPRRSRPSATRSACSTTSRRACGRS